MDRAWVAAVVAGRIPAVLADAGMAGDATGLAGPIDDALRALGTAEADLATATSDDPVGFAAMVEYHALRAALGRMSDRFDVTVAGGSYRLGQAVGNVERLLAWSEKGVLALFGTTEPGGAGGRVTTLDLAFLEPVGWVPV